MNSRTRSRKPASIGSNHSSRKPAAISASEPRTGNFVLLLVMAWSPPAHNAGIVWVSAPGDYATFNSNHTPDGTSMASSVSLWMTVMSRQSDCGDCLFIDWVVAHLRAVAKSGRGSNHGHAN